MLVKLGSKEAELAAEKYYLVHEFLETRNLDPDKYYDAVLDGFLNAVRTFCKSQANLSFKEIAVEAMNSSCIEMFSSFESDDISLCSLDDCLENGLPIEKAVADTIDVAREAINSIRLEETMQSFNASERRIAELLLAGYTERNIAELLNMNLLSVFHSIESICNKISDNSIVSVA